MSNATLFDQLYKIFILIFFVFMIVLTLVGVFKVYSVGNKVDTQTRFIINYLRCIGQIPQDQRGPATTNACFATYAPQEDN